MKHRTTALASLAALLAGITPAAWGQMATASSLQIYGQMTAAVVVLDHQTGGTTQRRIDNSLFAASLLGLRGSEDLGGGMSAVFRLETGLNSDTGAAGATVGTSAKFWNRQAFVGLNLGPATSVTVGRQFHAATDRVIQTLDVYNVGGTSLAVTPLGLFGVNKFVGNDSRVDDSVKVRLRGPSGLTGALSAGLNDGAGRSHSFDLAQVTPGYAVGVYGIRFQAPTVAANGTKPVHTAYGLGGNVTVGPVRLIVHHMIAALDPSAVGRIEWKSRITHLGADWKLTPQLSLKPGLYHDRGTAINGVTGRDGSKDTIVLNAEYTFSRRTSIHAAWFSNRFTDGYRLEPANIAALGRDPNAASTGGYTIGIRHDF